MLSQSRKIFMQFSTVSSIQKCLFTTQVTKLKVYESMSNDPFFNLATEDWLLREGDFSHTLFLWRNAPTIVIGRHQNPYKECLLQKMDEKGITLARRHSGGGAVYQDLGNSIFTFISPQNEFSKEKNSQIIINALATFNIKAEASGRNDILVDGLKVSGSAYKIQPPRALHHGTLLIDTNLDDL